MWAWLSHCTSACLFAHSLELHFSVIGMPVAFDQHHCIVFIAVFILNKELPDDCKHKNMKDFYLSVTKGLITLENLQDKQKNLPLKMS